MEQIIFGHTYIEENDELHGAISIEVFSSNNYKYYCVELNLLGGYTISEFSDLETTCNYKKKNDLIYRFIEAPGIQNHNITVLHKIPGSNKVVGYHNYYGIGNDWKFFINSKDDITLQNNDPKISTERFRNFDSDNTFFVNLACLIYTVNNFSFQDSSELRSKFNRINQYVTSHND